MRTRYSARAVVVTEDLRVLLFKCVDDVEVHDPARPGASTYWQTPGGGIEDGESAEEAARRELREETGITDAALGPSLRVSERIVSVPGRKMIFHETLVLARTNTTEVNVAMLAGDDLLSFRGFRWWTLEELRTTDEAVVPADLIEIIEAAIAAARS